MFSSSTLTVAAFQAPRTLGERDENKLRRSRSRSRRFRRAGGHQNEKSDNFTNTKSASSDEKRYLTTKKDDDSDAGERIHHGSESSDIYREPIDVLHREHDRWV